MIVTNAGNGRGNVAGAPVSILPPAGASSQTAPLGAISWLSIGLFALMYANTVAYNSQVVKFFGDNLYEHINRTYYVVAFLCFAFGVLQSQFMAAAISLAIFLYLSALTYIGAKNTPLGVTHNLFLAYAALGMSPLVTYMFKTGKARYVERIVMLTIVLYGIAYIYFSLTIGVRAQSGNGYIIASGERGARLTIDTGAVTAGFFIALAGLCARRFIALNALAFALMLTVIYLSGSRMFSLTVAAVSCLYLVTRSPRWIAVLAGIVLLAASLYMLSNLLLGENPFIQLATDDSARARMQEFQTILRTFQERRLFGIGIYSPFIPPGGAPDFRRIVFWSDLGVSGIIYAGGCVGLVVYAAMSFLCLSSVRNFRIIGEPRGLTDGLSLALCALVALGWTAPLIWTNGLEIVAFAIGILPVVVRLRL